MPKQTPPKPLTDKQKIRMLEQDIKEMQKDFKETFSVFEEEKPPKHFPWWGIAATVIIAAALAYLGFAAVF